VGLKITQLNGFFCSDMSFVKQSIGERVETERTKFDDADECCLLLLNFRRGKEGRLMPNCAACRRSLIFSIHRTKLSRFCQKRPIRAGQRPIRAGPSTEGRQKRMWKNGNSYIGAPAIFFSPILSTRLVNAPQLAAYIYRMGPILLETELNCLACQSCWQEQSQENTFYGCSTLLIYLPRPFASLWPLKNCRR
jgi:hypothetical protein